LVTFFWVVRQKFLEIYNESVYDLLNVENEAKSFSDWDRLDFFEAEDGSTEVKNLKLIEVESEHEALQLLMKGNFLRHSASTTMNSLSSRSHSIFTIYLRGYSTVKKAIINSKFNLVDLAGSERVNKSNTAGVLLDEAKNINKSLSYLEQVVMALDEKKQGQRVHVPFRNSALTMILKDSLAGNCIISMVATLSVESLCLDESVSTARFSMRCQKLETSLNKNLEFDGERHLESSEKNEI
jgi:kinesin family protein 6/9